MRISTLSAFFGACCAPASGSDFQCKLQLVSISQAWTGCAPHTREIGPRNAVSVTANARGAS